jgi:hypothetical protein
MPRAHETAGSNPAAQTISGDAMDRDIIKDPYDKQERRVCDYLQKLLEGMIGCGDDPVGFLIASHNALSEQARTYAVALRTVRREARKNKPDPDKIYGIAHTALEWDPASGG